MATLDITYKRKALGACKKNCFTSSPELQIASYSVADSEIITDTENVNAMWKLSLNIARTMMTNYKHEDRMHQSTDKYQININKQQSMLKAVIINAKNTHTWIL